MQHHVHHRSNEQQMLNDMGKGFGSFVDEVLRGRQNKTILNSSVGLAALEMGAPDMPEQLGDLDITTMVTNNADLFSPNLLRDHPLFRFQGPEGQIENGFTLFGLDFHDFWNQLTTGAESVHHTPYFEQSVGERLGLPDLPYGELAHFAHMGMALYDTGRTFQDLWNEPALKHNVAKILTHPDMTHTLAARGTMLTVMGLLHPLGPVVAIGVAYLCAHLVHSFFGLLERNKDTIRQIENVPVLKHIYNASGVKEWAERDTLSSKEPASEPEKMDPFQELELNPDRAVKQVDIDGRIQELVEQHRAKPA